MGRPEWSTTPSNDTPAGGLRNVNGRLVWTSMSFAGYRPAVFRDEVERRGGLGPVGTPRELGAGERNSPLEDPGYPAGILDIRHRIGVHQDQVGQLARLDRAQLPPPPRHLGRAQRRHPEQLGN